MKDVWVDGGAREEGSQGVGVAGGGVRAGGLFGDVVVHAHAAVAAPASLAVGVLEVDFRAKAHDDMAGAAPRSGRVVYRRRC